MCFLGYGSGPYTTQSLYSGLSRPYGALAKCKANSKAVTA